MIRGAAVAVLVLIGLAVAAPLLSHPARAGGEERRAAPGVRLPAADAIVLASGTRLLLVPDVSLPLVSIHVRLPGGAFADPPGAAGRAALLAAWASRGAGERDAAAFRAAVESRGGRLTTYAAANWIGLDAEFLAEDLEFGLGLVRDVLERPRFDPVELGKARDLALARLQRLRTQPSGAVGSFWNAWLFGAHPWGSRSAGDEASLVRAADPDALRALWKELAAPPRRVIAVAGDFDGALVRRLLGGGAPAAPSALPPPPSAPAIRRGGVLLVDHPEALQTYFRFGGAGFLRTDPDHAARVLANTILGGRFTSRLNRALRTAAGLTYGARSRFDDDRGGAFAVNTYTETATSAACIDLARKVYAEFVASGMTAAELASARTYVKGQFAPDELETPAQQAVWLLDLTLHGMSRDFIDGFFARLDAVTLEGVNRVITERFPQQDLAWVVIGRAAVLREIVAPLGDVTEVKLAQPGFGPR